MPGIDNLKVALKFAVGLTEAVVEKLDDKKLTLWEVLGLAPQLATLPGIIANADALWDELKDLDDVELEELNAYVAEELDIPDDDVEDVIENALNLVTSVANLAFSIKRLSIPDIPPVE